MAKWFVSLVTVALCTAAWAGKLDSRFSFEIPAQAVSSALLSLSEQANLQVMTASADLKDVTSPGVRGDKTVREALDALLTGTGLKFQVVSENAVAVGRVVEGRTGAATPMVMAQAETGSAANATHAEGSEKRQQEEGAKLEEVVVTAQKRKERLNEVPLSVEVLRGSQLDSSTQQGLNDALRAMPSVSLSESLFAGISYPNIRGVGGSNFTGSTPVGYYLDSAPFALVKSAIIPDVNDFDMQRVEVLRGPQGTLFGANAENGVIRIITHDADTNNFEFKSRLSASNTEGGGENYRADGAVNVPLIQNVLGARLVLGYQDLGGWIDHPDHSDANTDKVKNARLRVLAQPTNNLTVRFSSWISRNSFDNPSLGDDHNRNVDLGGSPGHTDFNVDSVQVDYGFSAFTLTSTSSYLDLENISTLQLQEFAPQAPPLGLLGYQFLTGFNSHSFSQEILLNSHPGGSLEWTLGGFYRNAKDRALQVTAPDPTVFAKFSTENDSKSYAAFGQVTGHFTPTLTWTTGLRYFHDSVFVGNLVSPYTSDSADFSAVTPRVALTWIPNQNLTVYASYSQGFRSGFPQDPSVVDIDPSIAPAKPERLHNYEIGTHSSSLDGRVRVDAAAYYIKWDEVQQQLTVADPAAAGGFITAITNGASASGPGLDLSMAVEPIRKLSFGISLGWNDLKFDKDVLTGNPPTVLFAHGTRLGFSPELTGAASLDYAFPLSKSFEGNFNLSANYSDPIAYVGLLGLVKGDPVFISNARFALRAPHNWTATLFVNNLANENPILSPYQFLPIGFTSWSTRTRPRTIGVQLEYRY